MRAQDAPARLMHPGATLLVSVAKRIRAGFDEGVVGMREDGWRRPDPPRLARIWLRRADYSARGVALVEPDELVSKTHP